MAKKRTQKTPRKVSKPKEAEVPAKTPAEFTEPPPAHIGEQQQVIQNRPQTDEVGRRARMTLVEKCTICNLAVFMIILFTNVATYRHIREDARLEKRAWIGLETPVIRPVEIGKPISFEMSFANTGKTPAIDAVQQCRILAAGRDIDELIVKFFTSSDFGTDPGKTPVSPNASLRVFHTGD